MGKNFINPCHISCLPKEKNYQKTTNTTFASSPLSTQYRSSINKKKGYDKDKYKPIPIDTNTYFYELPNGLKLFLKKNQCKNICGISLSVRVSQLDEDINSLGLNQLTSNLMLFGNSSHDYYSGLEFCASKGFQFFVSNGKETTDFRMKCFSEDIVCALNFLKDTFISPIFPNVHLLNLKKTLQNNIHRISDYPQIEAVHLWEKMLFGENSNILSIDGTIKTIKSLNSKMVNDWYKNKVLTAPISLCIVGNVDFGQVIEVVEELDVELKKYEDRSIAISPSYEKKLILNKNLNQSIINFGGFCMPDQSTDLHSTMNILSQIIGGEVHSRMFDLLREKHGVAYTAEFDYSLLRDLGYFQMFAVVDKAKEDFAINLLIKMLIDLKKNGVTKDEMIKTKNFIQGQMYLDEESVLTTAQIISNLTVLGYDYEFYQSREKRLNNVTKDQIKFVLDKYFNVDDLYLHIVS
jgi:predicted Zn-dependent peptidase